MTPGNFSSTGGAVFQKPDITAADDVTTDVPGFAHFKGTSAAAPHAAAIAALLKSYNTNLTALQIRTVLTNTALDIMAAGIDRDSGAGIVMALAALQATEPDLTQSTAYLHNPNPHAGDTVTASITITNQSCTGFGNNAGAFHVGFYWSTSPSFSGVSPFYEAPLSGCTANSAVPLIQNITIGTGTAPGTYYLGFKINDENEVVECNTNNNDFYWTVTVLPPPQPDLTKGTDNLNNLYPSPGATVTASVTITNESCTGGSTNAGAFHVGFYWSTSPSFSGVSPFYEAPLSGCAANGTVSLTNNITIGSGVVPGTYYLGYNINNENEVVECNTDNNGIFYWTVTVTDTNPPTINITSPTSGQKMTNALATVIGTAADNWQVSNVWYQLNGGPWSTGTTTNSYTNWTTPMLTLIAGTNSVKAYALDLAGNISTTNNVSFVSSNAFKLLLAFTTAQPLATNGLNFVLQISPGLNGHIQISTNLVTWTTLTNFVGTNTTLNFRDPSATNFNQQFYRAVIP